MMWAILSFYAATAFFYLVDLIQKVTSARLITWDYIFVRSLYTTLLTFLITLLWKGLGSMPPARWILEMMLASVVCCWGLYFYIKSINSLHFSNVGALSIFGTVLQQLYAYAFTDSAVYTHDIIACALMSVGSIVQLTRTNLQKGTLYVLGCIFFWTTGYLLLSKTLQKTELYWSVPFMELTVLLVSGCFVALSGKQSHSFLRHHKRYVPVFILLALLIYIASFCNNYSFKFNSFHRISMLQLSLMPVAFFLSMKLFHEKLQPMEWISFLSSVAGFALYVLG